MVADRITLRAPAKVNLYLAVGPRRPDGYHDLTTVFQALDERASDTVTVSPAPSLQVVCEPDIGVPVLDNLAARAVTALADATGREPHLRLHIRKRIPAAGGLGGASSDAAAALLGACALWGVDPASSDVVAIARRLGADVVFFLTGGTALYAGRGDELVETLPTPSMSIVLVNPGEPVPTPAAYAEFDRLPVRSVPSAAPLLAALRSGDVPSVAGAMHNGLDEAACAIAPGSAAALRHLRSAPGVLGALVSGSGSTVFGVCADEAAATAVAAKARSVGWWACVTASADAGIVEIPG